MNVDYALYFQVALKHKMHKIGTKKSLSAFFFLEKFVMSGSQRFKYRMVMVMVMVPVR